MEVFIELVKDKCLFVVKGLSKFVFIYGFFVLGDIVGVVFSVGCFGEVGFGIDLFG